MQGEILCRKYCVHGYDGLLCIMILKSIVRVVMFVKELDDQTKEIKCLQYLRSPCKHLINGQ